jgi:SAM-dependent methyltransferase
MGEDLQPETEAGAMVSPRWVEWRRSVDLDKYDARWESMAARGDNVHGEADAVERLATEHFEGRRIDVLDAGCGTGRLGIELNRRGHRVVGADLDPDMIDRARAKAPDIEWHVADLAQFTIDRRFDVIVLAGNIFLFCAPGSQSNIVTNLANHLNPGGLLVAGWSQEDRPDAYLAQHLIAHGEANGLGLVSAWKNWEGDVFDDGDYAVIVMQRND